jgi:initiation factor 1A
MVKNGKGGNKGKKIGRKHIGTSGGSIRIKREEGELYAVVLRICGGSNCEVHCEDGKQRLCIIRNKFRGRGKRGNEITSGVWVMVGMREWEADNPNKRQKCDLLEVYSHSDKKILAGDYPGGWSELTKVETSLGQSNTSNAMELCDEVEDIFEWDDGKSESNAMKDIETTISSKEQEKNKSTKNNVVSSFGEVVNIDDI